MDNSLVSSQSGLPTQDQELILRDYTKLAYGLARAYQNKGLPLEDLRQEALLGLLFAARRYQPEQGAQFSTYAVYWIKKQILQALAREGSTSLQAESLEEKQAAELAAPEASVIASEALTIPDGIPELERQILISCFQKQLTLKDISQALQIPVERVKQLRGKALRRMKSTL